MYPAQRAKVPLENCSGPLKRAAFLSSYQLYGYHEDGLEGEGSVTEIK